jgi:hypothetical protein
VEIGPQDVIVDLCTVLIEKLRIFWLSAHLSSTVIGYKFVSEGENITGSPFFSRDPVEIFS